MSDCIALASIAAATNCADIDNRAGVVDRILFGFADEVGTWPVLPAPSGSTALTFEEAGQWDGSLAMTTGKRMYELAFTDETGVLTITDQGEKGGESFLYELTLIRAKINATMAGFENAVKGRNLVIIVQDRNGVKYLMGDELSPAIKVAGDGSTTGTSSTDRNQTTLKFQYTCPRKLVYTGSLDSLLTAAAAAGGS